MKRTIIAMLMMLVIPVMAQTLPVVKGNSPPDSDKAENSVAEQDMSPERMAKIKIMESLTEFLDMSKEALKEGGHMAKEGMKEGVAVAREQIPLILKEIVIVRRVQVVINFIMCLIVIALLCYGAKKIKQSSFAKDKTMAIDAHGNELYELGSVWVIITTVIKWFGIVAVMAIIITHIRDWCLPWFAPRVYLIEYAVELVKTLK